MRLPQEVETLAETFAAAGYRTGAFVSNVNLRGGLGFEQGFEVYSNSKARWKGDSAFALTREALAWVDSLDEGQPFFLWVHLLDPHWPYTPPAEYVTRVDPDWSAPYSLFDDVESRKLTKGQVIFFADQVLSDADIEHTRKRYQAEVVATDEAVGTLLSGLSERSLLDPSILLMTSDHGEALGDHRYWFAHGEYLYDDTLHVPWAVRAPGRVVPGIELEGMVLLEDIAPTLSGLAGLPWGPDSDGIDLSERLASANPAPLPDRVQVHLADHHLVHEENPRRPIDAREGRWWALRDGNWKLLLIPTEDGGSELELYRLDRDPGETKNLAEIESERAEAMARNLEQWRAAVGAGTGEAPETSREEFEALLSLGYAAAGRGQ